MLSSSSPPPQVLPIKMRRKSVSASDTDEPPSTASTHPDNFPYDFWPSSSPIASSVALDSSPSSSMYYAQIRYQSNPLHGYEIRARDLADDAHELDNYWSSHSKFPKHGCFYAGFSQAISPSLPSFSAVPFGYSSPSDDSEEPPLTSDFDMDMSEYSDDNGIDNDEDEDVDFEYVTHGRRLSYSTSAERDEPFTHPISPTRSHRNSLPGSGCLVGSDAGLGAPKSHPGSHANTEEVPGAQDEDMKGQETDDLASVLLDLHERPRLSTSPVRSLHALPPSSPAMSISSLLPPNPLKLPSLPLNMSSSGSSPESDQGLSSNGSALLHAHSTSVPPSSSSSFRPSTSRVSLFNLLNPLPSPPLKSISLTPEPVSVIDVNVAIPSETVQVATVQSPILAGDVSPLDDDSSAKDIAQMPQSDLATEDAHPSGQPDTDPHAEAYPCLAEIQLPPSRLPSPLLLMPLPHSPSLAPEQPPSSPLSSPPSSPPSSPRYLDEDVDIDPCDDLIEIEDHVVVDVDRSQMAPAHSRQRHRPGTKPLMIDVFDSPSWQASARLPRSMSPAKSRAKLRVVKRVKTSDDEIGAVPNVVRGVSVMSSCSATSASKDAGRKKSRPLEDAMDIDCPAGPSSREERSTVKVARNVGEESEGARKRRKEGSGGPAKKKAKLVLSDAETEAEDTRVHGKGKEREGGEWPGPQKAVARGEHPSFRKKKAKDVKDGAGPVYSASRKASSTKAARSKREPAHDNHEDHPRASSPIASPLPREEMQGLLIQTLALSRASAMPASALYSTIMANNPTLKDVPSLTGEGKISKREWIFVIEDVLEDGRCSCGVFEKVENTVKGASDHVLEAQWFYVPEKDEDQERAIILGSMMIRPAKRNETKKSKQYYWRPLAKISRWDPEDAM